MLAAVYTYGCGGGARVQVRSKDEAEGANLEDDETHKARKKSGSKSVALRASQSLATVHTSHTADDSQVPAPDPCTQLHMYPPSQPVLAHLELSLRRIGLDLNGSVAQARVGTSAVTASSAGGIRGVGSSGECW